MKALDLVLAIIRATVRTLPDTWNYSKEEDMFILNMKAECTDGYIIDLDCIVAVNEESKKLGKWYWHTRTIFCDYEGYEEDLDNAFNKSINKAFSIIRMHNAKRLDPNESNEEILCKNEEAL